MEKQESKKRFPTFPQSRRLRSTFSDGMRIPGARPDNEDIHHKQRLHCRLRLAAPGDLPASQSQALRPPPDGDGPECATENWKRQLRSKDAIQANGSLDQGRPELAVFHMYLGIIRWLYLLDFVVRADLAHCSRVIHNEAKASLVGGETQVPANGIHRHRL